MKKVVISGVTSGFGIEWLYQLDLEIQAEFFVLARNREKFERLIRSRPLNNTVHLIECDFGSLASTDNAASKIGSLTEDVDILINNAGVWSADEITFSNDGIEITFAVNQLAPFVLTGKLLPLLEASSSARIVNTASFRHSDAIVNKTDIQLKDNFNAQLAYCNSKLYSVLFTQKLAKVLSNSNITVNCFDPGIVDTPMLEQAFPKKLSFLYSFFKRFIARTPEKGAETGVYLSISENCDGVSGQYFKDRKSKEVSKIAQDNALESWLWEESEKLSGYVFPQSNGESV